MPPSPLDDRVVVALSRPVRPQDLNLCLDSSYLDSASSASESHVSLLSTAVVSLKAANLTYMPSSNGSARSLSCGCSSASCCTVATYDKDNQAQTQASTSSTSANVGTSTTCPANQMVNNNENSGPLSPSSGVGSPVSGPTKQLPSVKIIYPNELAKKMTKCSKTHQGPVIIDCRPFMEYNKSHIQGAVHINCSDKISRRRLQQGKITVLDLISCREGKDSFKRIFSKEIVVYDENTNEPSRVIPSQPLHIVLESLKREGKEPLVLKGGLSSFKQNHENLCDNSLQLQECPEGGGGGGAAAAVTCTLPQSIPTTPDIENAELTPILPFLFLGNEHDAQDLEKMQRLNIGYVINVTTHLPLYHYEKGLLNYKRLPATDSNKQNLRQYFEEAFEFIEEAHQCGKGLLIHCQAGVSRSATIVIAYLMKHTRMTMTDAYKFVKGKRPIISPNLNFMGQLLEFEEDLNNGVTPRILTPKLIGVETVV
ncbi:dual specificity protein phosphatase 10 [Podarcis muralis]|uniref:Dual specificity protein phosphatase 10 n=1 Tax=Podarcis muralis TaxID=64176 RepID=A0A670HV94_PODMU|nr:dual specificity protein phosphatase 10 [Podarcis muralis]XP_028580423.1 dual specificity protein phosphatase 10 [Podarcis muralis]XP_053239088.1 dual specificity protein phosphatase 10 [Podarcis raffonei]XP_053239089.1 dual specificity protein phosphatase 10 [Podarcis raffonei]XP_053239090.1 dual specificity protein phosphatase 10 [Podarcis raffonei]